MNSPLSLKIIINGFVSFMKHKAQPVIYELPIKWGKKVKRKILAPLFSMTPDKLITRKLTFMRL